MPPQGLATAPLLRTPAEGILRPGPAVGSVVDIHGPNQYHRQVNQPESPSPGAGQERLSYYRERVQQHSSPFPEYHAPSVDVIVTLLDAHHVVYTALSRALAEHDISLSALNLLAILQGRQPDGCPLGQLSDLMLVTPPGITGLVDSLVRKGLVERHMNPGDRRVRRACITPAGKDLVERVLPSHYRLLRALLAGLAGQELASLASLLARLSESVRRHEDLGRPEAESASS